ncbi:protein traS [Salmonella enterica subsp. enterica serovar Typhimurium]|nr:protein traS [Salmonella enterica subsp. enterica serovar Typhimurium]EBU7028427.1 protein traS [Salmonella enterica subsp. enterica serovar Typhimurium]EBW1508762.1 protein traS [Salmonella enterica subsp. enterica serovar Typhimurium]EBW7427767.1 protein traS [Salmonella enterica subsp. enterica serovar Typhimurium]ECF0862948.1 protein traS [Salmonella enterica subsp. enterica serovar Typhimurium]
MKRSDLEKDAAYILDNFKQLDYEIPSNRQILKVIFYKLVIVYVFQLLFIVSDIFINSNVSEYHYLDTFVLSLGSHAFFSLVFFMSTYNLVSLKLSLGSEITEQSVLLKLVERKINSYSLFLLAVNAIVGCILLSSGERFVAGLGFSWFVTYLISMLTLQTSLSRYMTPAVVSSLSKVKELLSASQK